jgi:hypothetical protein
MARTKIGQPASSAMQHNIAKLLPAAMGAPAHFPPFFVMANTAGPNRSVLFWVMAPRKKTLEELKSEAIDELKRRGYDVRGKTPAQIRQMLKARPKRQKADSSDSRTDSRDCDC